MSEKSLGVGDIVNVYFNGSGALFGAEIVYVPNGPGDCFKLLLNGRRYNVQQYEMMCDPELTNEMM